MRTDGLSQALRTLKHVSERQLVLLKQSLRFWLDQRGREAWKNWRCSARESRVNNSGLGEVCHFRRPTYIRQCRQEIVLYHGTEKHIGAEHVRRGFSQFCNIMRRTFLTAD